MPECHKKVFNYLMEFLQELLKNSGRNRLDANILGKATKMTVLSRAALWTHFPKMTECSRGLCWFEAFNNEQTARRKTVIAIA